MQYCPMCDKEYNKITKVCPIRHCPNCGSLEIKKQKSRRCKNDVGERIMTFVIFFGMAGIFVVFIAHQNGIIYHSISIPLITIMILISYFNSTIQNFSCLSCLSHKFTYVSNIKLKKIKKMNVESETEDIIEYENKDGIIKKIDSLSESQTIHHKRDLILKIIGISISVLLGTVGLLLNQDEIMAL